MKKVEIGIVYWRGDSKKLYLAVDSETLITVSRGVVKSTASTPEFRVVRGLSIDSLCETWCTTLGFIDDLTDAYLRPKEHRNMNTRQRISRKELPDDPDDIKRMRIHRLSL